MRCYEARRKLNEALEAGSVSNLSMELENHIASCPACARLVEAEARMRQDFSIGRVDDMADDVPLSVLKARVEREATSAENGLKENRFMTKLIDGVRRKPSFSVGVAVVAVVVALSMLVPFTYDRTIGYEVAFAGVDPELAMDSEKIDDFLVKLGVESAAIDVSDCEKTCKLKITELKTAKDAQLVKEAFHRLGNVVVLEEIHATTEAHSGSLMRVIYETAHGDGDNEWVSDDDVHHLIVERLGTDSLDNMLIWTDDDIKSHHEFYESLEGGEHEALFIGEDGKIDPDQLKALEEKGFYVTTEDKDGNVALHLQLGHDSEKVVEEYILDVQSDAAAKDAVEGELPDGFELSQNYPNPFNPTTTIHFTLPTSQHVSVEVYNIRGQLVKTLADREFGAGEHSVEWDSADEDGTKVASGVYLYRLTAGENVLTKKMILTK